MCGLAGYITKKGRRLTPNQKQKREGVLRGLLLAMQERGTHSTGIAGVNNNKIEIAKKALSAEAFVRQSEFINLLNKNNRIVIGHTRLATVGDKTDENAHPFQIGDIVGCHNGRVYDYERAYKDAQVDSEAIFYVLDKYKNSPKKSFKHLRGLFATTWLYGKDLDKLYFMVSGNPMFLIKIPEIDTYFWASTYEALMAVVGSHYSLDKKPFWSPKPLTVYSLDENLRIDRKPIVLKTISEDIAEDKKEREASEVKEESLKRIDDEKTILLPNKCDIDFDKSGKIERVDSQLILPAKGIEQYKQLMSLNTYDMLRIVEKINRDGCMMCGNDIELNIGFLWSTRERQVLCMRCGNEFQDYKEFLYITEEEYDAIEEEAFIGH